MTPINLLERFGNRYRIGWDSAYDPKHRPKDKLDPWAMEIPCRRGTIYSFDETHLCVMVDYHPKIAKRIASLPGVELVQDGDHEKTFAFPVEIFDQVAVYVKPHRRPQLTIEQRRAAAERLQQNLRKSQFLDAPTHA